jgi:hypothetical protein
MYSTRWHDVFTYAQSKTELRLPGVPLRPYVSVRFIGDVRGAVGLGVGLGPQFLSERSVILAVGIATQAVEGHHRMVRSRRSAALSRRAERPRPHRARLSRRHRLREGHRRGRAFAETNLDGIYVSRFADDMLLYSQTRTGFTFAPAQLFWNWNLTVDSRGEYWANFVETGPWRETASFTTSSFR